MLSTPAKVGDEAEKAPSSQTLLNDHNDRDSHDPESKTSNSEGNHSLRLASIALHASVLLLHITLAIVYVYHPEHALVVSLGYQGTASTIMTIVLQFVGLVSISVFL